MESPELRLLMIEDDLPQAELIKGMLAGISTQRYSVLHVQYLADGLRLLAGQSFDCVLVDLGLPDSQGLESALAVRNRAPQLPIVVLTVLNDEEIALKSLQMDIQDYLIKGEINQAVLIRSLRYAMQRKGIAEELLRSEERLRFATAAADLGTWHWDLVRNELAWSARCKELFGYAPEHPMSYQEFLNAIHEEDRGGVDAALSKALRDKVDYAAEMRVPLPDGQLRWVASKGRGSYDEQGSPVGMHGISFDITERKGAEAALVRAKEEWERTFDSVPDLIAILDTGRRLTRVNRAMAQRLGRQPEECIGLPCQEAMHATAALREACPHMATEADGKEHRAEMHEAHLGGHFLVSTTPLNGPDGEMLGVVHVARDVTELKKAGEQIERLNRELEQRAAELETANRELEAFNYTAAHDLRQPLNLISLHCQAIEMLCGQQLDDQCLTHLKDVYHATTRMSRLIEALLRFSRLAHVELHRQQVDLSAMAREVAAELQLGEPARRATFRVAEGVMVYGDPDLLRIVLDNLMGNAWKYTASREEAIIELGATLAGPLPACFVRDNGPGFQMAERDKLFTPFQRLSGAESRTGFGIGLATVERVVLRHGGRVWAIGEPGRGASFYFSLPPEEPEPPGGAEPLPHQGGASLSRAPEDRQGSG